MDDLNPTLTDAPAGAEPSTERVSNGSAMVPCVACGSTEPPDEQGLCPGVPGKKCRCTRVGSSLASKHDGRAKLTPTDYAMRDSLMERLFAERGGRAALDIVSQLRIEDYSTAQIQLGKVTRRLEALGAVSTEGRKRSSLVDTYNTFSARVERLAAELPAPRLVAAAEQMLVIRRIIVDPRDPEAEHDEAHYFTRDQRAHEVEPSSTPAVATTPTPSGCQYCGHTLAACEALKIERRELWTVVHGNDPAVAKEVDAEQTRRATAEMFAGLERRARGED